MTGASSAKAVFLIPSIREVDLCPKEWLSIKKTQTQQTLLARMLYFPIIHIDVPSPFYIPLRNYHQ